MASPEFQKWEVQSPYLNLHCGLGEGPYYEASTKVLRFVDIKQKKLHSVDLTKGPSSLATLELDVPITVTADIAGIDPRDKVLAGLKYGIAVLDRKTGAYEYVQELYTPRRERLRTNDGAVDPNGRLWLGTMTDFGLGEFQTEGAIHHLDGKHTNEVVVSPIKIPNSIGWSPDNKTMYYTSSTDRTIFAYDYDPAAGGAYANKRVFYQHDGPGEPDGFRVDTEGNLWSAVFGESRVIKVSPQGRMVGEIRLPTPNITCTQFVGSELFITTAQLEGENADKATAEERDLGGALFRIEVGARGLDFFEFKLE